MCGIIGYIGDKPAQPMLLAGLARMEYRGYDSAGIATLHAGKLQVVKAKGKVAALVQKVGESTATVGIGHTRWATHGEPSERNAHPHLAGKIAIVHNGIIENYKELKDELAKKGAVFASDTDSEVLAHLINSHYKGDLAKSVQQALRQVTGTFGLAVLSVDEPDKLVVARRGSPLLIGLSQTATFVASDPAALVGYVKDVIYLNDDELAVCTPGAAEVFDFDLHPKVQARETLQMELEAIQKQGYDHFLLKEIMEQPTSVEAVLRGRLLPEQGTSHLGGLNLSGDQIRATERIVIIGCGTAYYAGLLGKYLIESLTHIPVDVEVASEFRYRDPVLSKNSVALIISQSGETADTLACVEELKRRGVHTLGLVNVVGSTIARTVDGGIYLHAGPEISVASTKAFTNQVVAQMLFALHVARQRDLSLADGKKVVAALERLPRDIAAALKTNREVAAAASQISHFKNAIYLGRNTLFPIALEGALKLKEVSYVHAEAYAAGEVKHGPIALIDPDMLVVFLLGKGLLADKSYSNLEEIKARGGTVLMVTDTDAPDALRVATHSPWTAPLVMNVVLQLLAYHIAVACGRDVDQPRNLAKSVTVE
ncbi:MAG TPA: glutamine--fructose-6-phosphate transaminase (isomerizing) [Candidatus Saccharimonas sp.]|nr:glutamine--fructose-6-phosphate transaminase (isomerizing) [Candidatus Saccharimonas sp.]